MIPRSSRNHELGNDEQPGIMQQGSCAITPHMHFLCGHSSLMIWKKLKKQQQRLHYHRRQETVNILPDVTSNVVEKKEKNFEKIISNFSTAKWPTF